MPPEIPPDWPRTLSNVQGRSATLRVRGTIDQVRQVVVDTMDSQGWVPIRRLAPLLVFRQRIVGLLPVSNWVEVGLSEEEEEEEEEDGVLVSFTAYGNVGLGEGGAVWQIAEKLAKAFARRFPEAPVV